MTEEPLNKHTPGDPMPCKCGESVVEVIFSTGVMRTGPAKGWGWGITNHYPYAEITDWRFIERKGEDVIQRCAECDCEGGPSDCNWIASEPGDPYSTLEWDEENTAIVVLKTPGHPEWVLDDDLVRFDKTHDFDMACEWNESWDKCLSFQIKHRPILTPAKPQLLDLLSAATDAEADAIRSAARRANIEVPE